MEGLFAAVHSTAMPHDDILDQALALTPEADDHERTLHADILITLWANRLTTVEAHRCAILEDAIRGSLARVLDNRYPAVAARKLAAAALQRPEIVLVPNPDWITEAIANASTYETLVVSIVMAIHALRTSATEMALHHTQNVQAVLRTAAQTAAGSTSFAGRVCGPLAIHDVLLPMSDTDTMAAALLVTELARCGLMDEAESLLHDVSDCVPTPAGFRALATNNIAVDLIDAGEIQQAFTLLHTLDTHDSNIPKEYLAHIHHNIGKCCVLLERYSSAREYFGTSDLLAHACRNNNLILENEYWRIHEHVLTGDIHSASMRIARTIQELDETISDDVTARVLFMEQVVRSHNGMTVSWDIARHAIERVHSAGERGEAGELVRELANMYARCGRPADAFTTLQVYLDERVWREAERSNQRLKALALQHEVDLLRRNKEMLEEREREKQNHIEELEKRIGSANQSLLLTVNSLKELERQIDAAFQDIHEAKVLARTLRTLVRESPVFGGSWEAYLAVFSEVHPTFLEALRNAAPDLTRMETKVCILTMAEMKSDDMAALLCLSTRTIETHRLNSRKKLGVPKDGSLLAFLRGLTNSSPGHQQRS
jgi:DNA-binding CsgD family transcriptional regulator